MEGSEDLVSECKIWIKFFWLWAEMLPWCSLHSVCVSNTCPVVINFSGDYECLKESSNFIPVLLIANQGTVRGPKREVIEHLEYFQNTEKITWSYYTEKKIK